MPPQPTRTYNDGHHAVSALDSAREWYRVANIDEIPSPALLVYLDRVDDNIRDMIAVAGSVERLRPHVKTHKLPEVIRRQLVLGIRKFKCATIAEAEMLAECGCPDVLLAYQPVGPNIHRLWSLRPVTPALRSLRSSMTRGLCGGYPMRSARQAAVSTCSWIWTRACTGRASRRAREPQGCTR